MVRKKNSVLMFDDKSTVHNFKNSTGFHEMICMKDLGKSDRSLPTIPLLISPAKHGVKIANRWHST